MISNRIYAIAVFPAAADKAVTPGTGAAEPTPTPAQPRPTSTGRPSKSGKSTQRPRGARTGHADRVFSSPGGTALVRCRSDQAYLVSWSPLPGFHVQDVRRGPSSVAVVMFDSEHSKTHVAVRCMDGEPQVMPFPQELPPLPPEPKLGPGGQLPGNPEPRDGRLKSWPQ
jgi:hypothetical protein